MPILVVDEEEERCFDDSTPILKEFIPLKPTVLKKLNDDDDEGDRLEKMSRCSWLKSAQLWNNDKKTLSSPNKNVINSEQFFYLNFYRSHHLNPCAAWMVFRKTNFFLNITTVISITSKERKGGVGHRSYIDGSSTPSKSSAVHTV